ncbi:MAG: hypothetical protein HYZ87_00850, partial [Candidatus Omnitrophica bacterium]|nr:hypothetical protein [Candidatus Omnitrophota bacterium]
KLSSRKVPVLGSIPLVGQAFRYDDKDNVERELLIFITPHLVTGYDSLAAESATPTSLVGGRDLAIKRMLDNFKDREVGESLDAWKGNKLPVSPIIEREMTQALGTTSGKTGSKPNR